MSIREWIAFVRAMCAMTVNYLLEVTLKLAAESCHETGRMMMECGCWFKEGNTTWDTSNNQAHPVNARVPTPLHRPREPRAIQGFEAGMHD